ncbi:hypothetical protein ACHAW5_006770 [Stephanodiscus triporus]|uniref:Uncharacterized protein n=1 Tax=Stephanodiscus triporus TaxID=2934178 RepID=A0ABD3NPA2_9STRA
MTANINIMSSINFNSQATLDRTGIHRKVHDWILYVNVLVVDDNDDNADLIKKVEFNLGRTFDPPKFVSYCPIKAPGSGSPTNRWWRFQTRQQTYGPVGAKIAIIGRGGTVLRRDFQVALSPGGTRNPNKPLAPIPMADTKFGRELELSSDILHRDVASLIEAKASVVVRDMTGDALAAADSHTDVWCLVTDSLLQCSTSSPNCNTFELVSPILQVGAGLGEVDRVMRTLGKITPIKINKSMGFHVHVNVQSLSLDELKNVCQNFVKYEEAMDKLMPESRCERKFCKSNRSALGGPETPKQSNSRYDRKLHLEG